MKKQLSMLVCAVALALFQFGCEEGPMEETGEQMDEATEEVGKQVEDAGESLKDTAEEAQDELQRQ